MRKRIVVAGASGDLGYRISKALVGRGACVQALVRPSAAKDKRDRLQALGADVVEVSLEDETGLVRACAGARCVVSSVNGLRDVIIEGQSTLLKAAVAADVPRFIPSDYSEDYTGTTPGCNRNLDLRREFMQIVDSAPIKATSVLNGAFMDMLSHEMPLIQPRIRRVLYWHDASQPLDFTTRDDTAAFVASAAIDDDTPRFLRIAGDVRSVAQLAAVMTEVTGTRYTPQWAGSLGLLGAMIAVAKRIAPGGTEPFPAWQGMQYMRDQFSGKGKLYPLDNQRYDDLTWTTVRELMMERANRPPTIS